MKKTNWNQQEKLTLLTDFYELTMANGYFENGLKDTVAYFDTVSYTHLDVYKRQILVSQFKSPLIYVILGAALVSILMRERKDFAIIMAVVVFDVILGFFQEYQANATYESLKALVKPVATVMRNGERTEVEAHELVPGDVVLMDTGDKISADGNLLEAKSLSLNEAILTGESEPVVKRDSEPVYMGTTVVAGRGIMEVTATGKNTKLGAVSYTHLASMPSRTRA